MITANLKNWKVAEDTITVTLDVTNTPQNRKMLAEMSIKTAVALEDTQGSLNLYETDDKEDNGDDNQDS